MNFRTDWIDSTTDNNLFYSKEETIADVISNFDIRRYYSAEGSSVTVDGVTVQVIIQDHANPINESDVDKKILLPMDAVVYTGSYVLFRNQTWMINSNVTIVDDAYKLCQMQLCNYTLLFQRLTDYSIISIPCITSGKTFDNDESKVISLGANKKSILLPKTADTLTLKTDRRVYIDTRNETPYKLLDPDTTSYNYGADSGLIYIIGEQDTAQNTTTYPDRPDLGICNYYTPVVTPPIPVGNTYSEIKTSGDLLIGSNRARTLTATCYNADKTVNTTATITWSFTYPTAYESLFTVEYPTNRTATIMCGSTDDYDKLIGKVVKVSVSDGNGGFVGSLDLKIKMT